MAEFDRPGGDGGWLKLGICGARGWQCSDKRHTLRMGDDEFTLLEGDVIDIGIEEIWELSNPDTGV